ncbi:MAG TPA: GNAT family protein [Pseudonocardiaceae bacterium]|nr:GNAT family protein [Pseudonocardiaceae bacterium]
MADALTMPRLAADGFVLRAFEFGDVPLIQEASADPFIPLVTTVPTNASRSDARAFIERQHSRSATGAGYSFAIAEPDSGRAVGQIGLWLDNIGHGRASIGYWIVASRRRRGIAAAALRAITAWGLALPEVARLELYVEPWNTGSWRTAELVGYQREGLLRGWQEVDGQRRDMFMYAMLAP